MGQQSCNIHGIHQCQICENREVRRNALIIFKDELKTLKTFNKELTDRILWAIGGSNALLAVWFIFLHLYIME